MGDIVYIDYDCLLANHEEIIRYACRVSDTFSVVSQQKKPYSKRPPSCKHDGYLKTLEAFLISQVTGAREWPGTMTKDTHMVLCTYKACSGTRDILLANANPFLFSSETAEDLSFYRGGTPWLVTTSHERIACLDRPRAEDVRFFQDWLMKQRS